MGHGTVCVINYEVMNSKVNGVEVGNGNTQEGVVEVELPQNVLDDLLTYSGMVITGDNYTLKRITIE